MLARDRCLIVHITAWLVRVPNRFAIETAPMSYPLTDAKNPAPHAKPFAEIATTAEQNERLIP